jgi:hypothetical protein
MSGRGFFVKRPSAESPVVRFTTEAFAVNPDAPPQPNVTVVSVDREAGVLTCEAPKKKLDGRRADRAADAERPVSSDDYSFRNQGRRELSADFAERQNLYILDPTSSRPNRHSRRMAARVNLDRKHRIAGR